MYGDPTVTFAGSGLDRAAHLRANPQALTDLWGGADARCLVTWRGKPLMLGAGAGWLSPGHPVLGESRKVPTFLGLSEGAAWFAKDISAWEPAVLTPGDEQAFLDTREQYHPDLTRDYRFAELRGLMGQLPALEAELLATAKALVSWHDIHQFCARCGQPSAVAMAGWQRQCPSCKATHFPRTDPVVIMLITRGNKVLLGRSPGWPEGMFSLLAGFMEPGETLESAVRREVAEESGVTVGRVRYLASQPWPFPASLMIGCAGEALSDEITVDPAEIETALWLSREDMAQVAAGLHPVIRPPRKGAIAEFLLSGWLAGKLV